MICLSMAPMYSQPFLSRHGGVEVLLVHDKKTVIRSTWTCWGHLQAGRDKGPPEGVLGMGTLVRSKPLEVPGEQQQNLALIQSSRLIRTCASWCWLQ